MPIYEYACSKCEKTSDVMQKMSDPTPTACPACGAEGTLQRVVSRTSFVLKGGGWYSDLYGSTKKGDDAKPSTATTPSEKGNASPPTTAGASAAPAAPAPAPAATPSSSSASSSDGGGSKKSAGGQ